MFIASFSYSQSIGSLSGYIYCNNDKKPIPGAQVYVETNNGKVGTITDSLGHFTIKPLNPGHYSLNISYVSYQKIQMKDIVVRSDYDTHIEDVYLVTEMMDEVKIVATTTPLIDRNGGSLEIMDLKRRKNLPDNRNLTAVLETMSTEFFISDNKKEIHFRGSRNNMTAYVVDGMRVSNLEGIPGMAVSNMTVYAGGIPARYGDFTGGVVVVETMGYFDWLVMQSAKDRMYMEMGLIR